jgi:predicted transposase/invertase (TIGR01784 family)
MSEDEANRMIYEARLKAQRDEYSRIQGARQEGREEGWKEGRKEGWEKGEANATKKIILEMGKNSLGIKAIAAVTHLSEQEVNDILKAGKA